ncbi:MAG: hypothetical protein HC921_15220 [Synechococcaceae cyanobacterium SM2_3_1]|nr:hypothetical protein [Synechococcaceae cyanobacterium SM2_3_1]
MLSGPAFQDQRLLSLWAAFATPIHISVLLSDQEPDFFKQDIEALVTLSMFLPEFLIDPFLLSFPHLILTDHLPE